MDEKYLKEQQVKWGDFISECWEDEALAERFRKNPAGVMKEKGIDTEEGITYKVVEAKPNVRYIVLPNAEKKEDINETLQLLAKQFLDAAESNDGVAIPQNTEVRIMQNTADVHYLILPPLEDGLSEQDLGNVAGGNGGIGNNLPITAAVCPGYCVVTTVQTNDISVAVNAALASSAAVIMGLR